MNTSPETKNLIKALVACQTAFKPVSYDSKGYGYSYASLGAILAMVTPTLGKNKLVITQSVASHVGEVNTVGITTRLSHESGEYMEETLTVPVASMKGMNFYQSMGAAITYLRRYGLSSMLGISTEEDKDGAGEQTSPIKKAKPKPKPPMKKPKPEDFPETDITCPKCKDNTGNIKDAEKWEAKYNSGGKLYAKCLKCNEPHHVWEV